MRNYDLVINATNLTVEEEVNQILEALRNTKGHVITVSEEDINGSFMEMCRKGYYIEPTAAAAIAGVKKYLHARQQGIKSAEQIVSVFTGHGLKTGGKITK